MLETRERCSALIALTLEQVNGIMDNFIKQVEMVNKAPPPPPQAGAAQVAPLQSVVAEKPISFYKTWQPPSFESNFFNFPEEEEEEEENDSAIVDDDEPVIVYPPSGDEDEDELDDEYEEEEEEEQAPVKGKRRLAKAQPLQRYPLRKNPKQARIFTLDKDDKDKDDGEDLYSNEASSASDLEDEQAAAADSPYELRLLLRAIHNNPNTPLIQVLDGNLWSRRRFLEPLKQVRANLGHDGPRSASARDLFDRIINEARDVQIKLNALPGHAKVKCSLCCTTRTCTSDVTFSGDAKKYKYPVASRCIYVAKTLSDFCKCLLELAQKCKDTAGKQELFVLNKEFGRVLEANQNKRFDANA